MKLDPVQAEFGVLVGAAGHDAEVGEAVGVRERGGEGEELAFIGLAGGLHFDAGKERTAG